MKPIAVLLIIAVPLAAGAAVIAVKSGYGWLGTTGYFYGSLALVELAYLAALLSLNGETGRAAAWSATSRWNATSRARRQDVRA